LNVWDGQNIHHRWYPKKDSAKNLMFIHRNCHEAIHFGGSEDVKRAPGSLLDLGDFGLEDTPQWRAYLRSKQS
jgi:hypothetical protein